MALQNSLSSLLCSHRPLRTVLIGTSLGDESDQVVRAGLGVARAAGARVALVHAASLEPLPIDIGTGPDLEREQIARCREELSRQIERLGIQEPELAGSEVRVGAPYRILTEAAQRIGAGLIVVGATGSGPFAAELLGSTADRVLRKALCPVLVVRDGFQVPPRRVLAPVDLSTLSGDAFRCGLHLLTQLAGSGEIKVQAVYALSFLDALAARQRTGGMPIEEIERSAGEELRRFILENRSEAPFEVKTAVLPGEARFEILRELDEHPADLVILGTHGRGGLDRLVLGSVASTVARKAPCSVLVISPEAALAEGIADAVIAGTEPAWHREPAPAGR
ncbi:MAG TPA: universal stress protein [Thermoanaerobaculia bacterium]|nr:universal stress protein [Thermoanaerobaculia bacterium]